MCRYYGSMHGVIVSDCSAHCHPSLHIGRWGAASLLWLQISSQTIPEAGFAHIRITSYGGACVFLNSFSICDIARTCFEFCSWNWDWASSVRRRPLPPINDMIQICKRKHPRHPSFHSPAQPHVDIGRRP